MTKLSVNINKIALLRNSRGNDYPNLIAMAARALDAGAAGITVHPRPDARHITYQDVYDLAKWLKPMDEIEFNVEGYPSADFMALIRATTPAQCTLVPDAPDQLTSNHGWDIGSADLVRQSCAALANIGVRSSVFVDAHAENMPAFAQLGTDRVELYTERYAQNFASGAPQNVLGQYVACAQAAHAAGLGVNAGHDLNLDNLALLLQSCQQAGAPILEVSIGHAIVVESFSYGYAETIERYLDIINTL